SDQQATSEDSTAFAEDMIILANRLRALPHLREKQKSSHSVGFAYSRGLSTMSINTCRYVRNWPFSDTPAATCVPQLSLRCTMTNQPPNTDTRSCEPNPRSSSAAAAGENGNPQN